MQHRRLTVKTTNSAHTRSFLDFANCDFTSQGWIYRGTSCERCVCLLDQQPSTAPGVSGVHEQRRGQQPRSLPLHGHARGLPRYPHLLLKPLGRPHSARIVRNYFLHSFPVRALSPSLLPPVGCSTSRSRSEQRRTYRSSPKTLILRPSGAAAQRGMRSAALRIAQRARQAAGAAAPPRRVARCTLPTTEPAGAPADGAPQPARAPWRWPAMPAG